MFEISVSEPVADELAKLYGEGGIILEYGTGGSTFLALESNQNNIVYGCETDPEWLSRLSSEVGVRQLNDRFIPVYQYIGKTTKFGNPCFETQVHDDKRGRLFATAPISPWNLLATHGVSPDFILIDGRFRVASFLASFFNVTKPCTVIFDDYITRPNYQVVESLAEPSRFVDNAAIFDLVPNTDLAVNGKSFLDFYAMCASSFS